MKAKSKIECCGSNFENDNISSIGLLTLSTPIIIVSSLIYIIFLALSFIPFFKKSITTIKIILKANVELIEKKDFFDIAFTKRMKRSKRRYILPEAV